MRLPDRNSPLATLQTLHIARCSTNVDLVCNLLEDCVKLQYLTLYKVHRTHSMDKSRNLDMSISSLGDNLRSLACVLSTVSILRSSLKGFKMLFSVTIDECTREINMKAVSQEDLYFLFGHVSMLPTLKVTELLPQLQIVRLYIKGSITETKYAHTVWTLVEDIKEISQVFLDAATSQVMRATWTIYIVSTPIIILVYLGALTTRVTQKIWMIQTVQTVRTDQRTQKIQTIQRPEGLAYLDDLDDSSSDYSQDSNDFDDSSSDD
ncbi:hypothetical protein M501DRAFT_985406 [Patellaria atrata CBS 101060]|uniref:Uncharacterized protein n=1 Tax=Patellaria atrata CBS 101060 TaxID=1346257 RepID=A0A9P4VX04_9PEZI|nr:hypothetical protein M501DRAFT_985406 [Patellaria atrata CBS 101060]